MSWQDLFRENAVADVRVKYSQLLEEKAQFHKKTNSMLGAAHPEILELCATIKQLGPAADRHQTAIHELSSVENTNRWQQIQANARNYLRSEQELARARALANLKESLLDSLEMAVANRELLLAARTHYLIEALGGHSESTALDDKLSQWLDQPSADNDTILAYIIRYKVSPSQLAVKLAQQRLLMLPKLEIIPAVDLVDQTVFTLGYIADYELKFQKTSARLVDSLRVDKRMLPASVLEVPLYPEECFLKHRTQNFDDFSAKANQILLESATKLIAVSTSAQVVQVYSSLVRDAPQLAESLRQACKSRIELVIDELADSLQAIKLPSAAESDPFSVFDSALAEVASQRALGESGTLKQPLQDTRAWLARVGALKAQIKSLLPLKSRDPALGPVCNELEQSITKKTEAAISLRLESLSSCAVVNILFVRALHPTASQLAELYDNLCHELCDKWEINKSTAQIPPFPSKGLLNSMASLVDLMDDVAVGFVWDDAACEAMRKIAFVRLEDQFPEEKSFLQTAFGYHEEQRVALDRVRTLLYPLVV